MKTEIKQHELNIPEYTQLMAWLEKKAGKDRPLGWSALVYAQYLISQNPTEWWDRYHKQQAKDFDYSKGSYRCNTGKYQEFCNKVENLIPESGAVIKSFFLPSRLKPKQSFKPLLECFRVFINIYYDLYNNGGDNMYQASEVYDEDLGDYVNHYEWRSDVETQIEHIDSYLGLPKTESLEHNYSSAAQCNIAGMSGRYSNKNYYWIERVGDGLLEKLKKAYKDENAHLLKRLVGIEE
tara:strand:- start:2043 stop:2753 length:711 start_codon:yes stop_codon:yes gene_type:complete